MLKDNNLNQSLNLVKDSSNKAEKKAKEMVLAFTKLGLACAKYTMYLWLAGALLGLTGVIVFLYLLFKVATHL